MLPAMTRIGLWLFEDVEELDVVGPWEVLASWAQGHPEDGVEVFTFARDPGPIRCRKGLRVLPDVVWADGDRPPACDVVLVPGGEGNRALIGRPWVREALRGWHAGGTLVTSVCSGALLLGGRRPARRPRGDDALVRDRRPGPDGRDRRPG